VTHAAFSAPQADRSLFPDLARAWALFGIAVVNVMLFAYPSTTGYSYAQGAALSTAADKAAWFTVNALFTFKSYTLFSFMFGVGFALQMASAERAGVGFAGRYVRRLVGLGLLGALNVAALFYGDILIIYAVLGALLWRFRDAPPERLVRRGIGVYFVQVALVALYAVSAASLAWMAPEDIANERAALTSEESKEALAFLSSSFWEVARTRLVFWRDGIVFGALMQGPGAFAFFLFGLAAVRRGWLADPRAEIWSRCRRRYLPWGMLGSAVGAGFMISGDPFDPAAAFGLLLITTASPFATFGYLGVIASWVASGQDGALQRFLARAGSASLSGYLLQGLLISLVFCGYGLGLFAQPGAAACIGIAAAAGIASLLAMGAWRARFARGPFEHVLRAWTYLGGASR
jgi:uncharacterized protein